MTRRARLTEAVRAPEERFADLPDFPYEPRYREVDGLRLAHLDEGDGAARAARARRADLVVPVAPRRSPPLRRRRLPLHRARPRRLRPLRQAGRRSAGTPTTATPRCCAELVERLDLRGATIVVHDWGGPIGLRVAVEQPRADRPHRRDRHRPLHRPPADERRVDDVPRLRRAHRGPADRDARARRLPPRPGRRGDRRLRGAVPRRAPRRPGRARSR